MNVEQESLASAQQSIQANIPPEGQSEQDHAQPALDPIDADFQKQIDAYYTQPAGEPATADEKAADTSQEAPPKQEEQPKKKVKIRGEEVEVTEDELYKLASAGGDYTRQMQALREREAQLTGLEALQQRLQQDQGFANHVFGYGRRSDQPTQSPPAQEQDPIAAFEAGILAKAKEEVMRELAPAFAPVAQIQRERVGQAVISNVASHYGEDAQLMENAAAIFVEQMPPMMRQAYQQRIASSPEAMAQGVKELFDVVRPHVEELKKQHAAHPQQSAVRAETPRQAAPVLEGAGVETADTGRSLQKESQALYRKIRNHSASVEDQVRYLELSMRGIK